MGTDKFGDGGFVGSIKEMGCLEKATQYYKSKSGPRIASTNYGSCRYLFQLVGEDSDGVVDLYQQLLEVVLPGGAAVGLHARDARVA